MSEPREFESVPLKRAARSAMYDSENMLTKSQSSWTAISLATQSRAQIGAHTVKSGSTRQSMTALSVGEAEFFNAAMKGGQVGLSLRCVYMDLGFQMKVGIQSDSSRANSLTDRSGVGPRTKHIDARFFWVPERGQDGYLSIMKVLTAMNCAFVGTQPVSASVVQQHFKISGWVFY